MVLRKDALLLRKRGKVGKPALKKKGGVGGKDLDGSPQPPGAATASQFTKRYAKGTRERGVQGKGTPRDRKY